MDLSLRKALNLAYAWLLDLLGGTPEWEKEWAPIFRDYEAEGQDENFDYVDLPAGSSGLMVSGV